MSSVTKTTTLKRPSDRDYNYLFKILVVGDSGVGKSCLLQRYTDDTFSESFIATIGVDFRFRTVENEGKTSKLQIWDTAGQDRFRSVTSCFYRGAHGIIVVYDVTDKESFNNLKGWINDCRKYSNESVKMLLVGNKCDLSKQKVVDTEAAREFAGRMGMTFIETSAKDSTNVELAFLTIAGEIQARQQMQTGSNDGDSFNLEGTRVPTSRGTCC